MDIVTNDIYTDLSVPGNSSMWPGRFGSQDPTRTAGTSQNAARGLYEVVQAWVQNFPALPGREKDWDQKKLSVYGATQ
jgi:hypothetical protein